MTRPHPGKIRHAVLDRPHHTPVQRGELVRLKGYGTRRRMRFLEYVERPDAPDRSYVTVLDTVERGGSGAYISVRPDQVSRVRNQPSVRSTP